MLRDTNLRIEEGLRPPLKSACEHVRKDWAGGWDRDGNAPVDYATRVTNWEEAGDLYRVGN